MKPGDAEVPSADRPWAETGLDDLLVPAVRELAARHLAAAFADQPEAWAIGWLLLREGWTQPLAALPAVVSQLVPTRKAA